MSLYDIHLEIFVKLSVSGTRAVREMAVTDISLAVAREIPRPRLTASSGDSASFRLPQSEKLLRSYFIFAGPRGIEPRLMVLETIVLPLNYRPNEW